MIFIICAYVIAKRSGGNPFLHGVFLGLANSVWMTSGHVLLFHQYAERHQKEMEMMQTMPMMTHPRLLMLITGPIVGLVSGLVIGLFAWIASKFIKR